MSSSGVRVRPSRASAYAPSAYSSVVAGSSAMAIWSPGAKPARSIASSTTAIGRLVVSRLGA